MTYKPYRNEATRSSILAGVADATDQAAEQVKPKAQEVAKKAGEVADAGLFAAGKQLGRASGMFSAFKEEFDKAIKEEDE